MRIDHTWCIARPRMSTWVAATFSVYCEWCRHKREGKVPLRDPASNLSDLHPKVELLGHVITPFLILGGTSRLLLTAGFAHFKLYIHRTVQDTLFCLAFFIQPCVCETQFLLI